MNGSIEDLLARSDSDVPERVTSLELKVADQQLEIERLQSSLADVFQRLDEIGRPKYKSGRIYGKILPSQPKILSHRGFSTYNGSLAQSQEASKILSVRTSNASLPHTSPKVRQSGDDSFHRWNSSSDFTRNPASRTRRASRTRAEKNAVRKLVYDGDGIANVCVGSQVTMLYGPARDFSRITAAPAVVPTLEWIYGYRGKDSRCNLSYLPTGEYLYFIASVVVLYDHRDRSQRHYTAHSCDVRCLVTHPDSVTVATGQESAGDEGAYVLVWDAVSLHTYHVLGKGTFTKAVTAIAFSQSDGGEMLLAVDDAPDRLVLIWRWSDRQLIANHSPGGSVLLGCRFSPWDTNSFFLYGRDGISNFQLDRPTGKISAKKMMTPRRPKSVLCLAFDNKGLLVTGDTNGDITLYNHQSLKVLSVNEGHKDGVFCFYVSEDGVLISGGGKDRKLLRWRLKSGYLTSPELLAELPESFGGVRTIASGTEKTVMVGTTRNCLLMVNLEDAEFTVANMSHCEELWGLSSHPSLPRFLTCGLDMNVIEWDATTHLPLWSKFLEEGCTACSFHPLLAICVVGLQSGRWIAINTDSRQLFSSHTDSIEQVNVLAFSADGLSLAVGCHDNYIYVYTMSGERFTRVGRCSGHSKYISSIDWSIDSKMFRSCSGDYQLLHWNTLNLRQVQSQVAILACSWSTNNCLVTYDTVGSWPRASDVDINTCDVTTNGKLYLTGDDSSSIRIYRFPCSSMKAESVAALGHTKQVTGVRLLCDDHSFVSIGGRDMSIIQWSLGDTNYPGASPD